MNFKPYDAQVRLRSYTVPVTVFNAVSARDQAKVLLRIMPTLTELEHQRLAAKFEALSREYNALHIETLHKAFLAQYGRLPGMTDYRITAVWDDTLPEKDKELLRKYAYGASKLARISSAHSASCQQLTRRRQPRPLHA